MKNVILKKVNGETSIKQLEDLRKINSSLIEIEDCFNNVIDKKNITNAKKADIDDARKTINHLINAIATNPSRHLIEDAFENLKYAKTKKDILNIISDVVAGYINAHHKNNVTQDEKMSTITPDVITKHLESLLKSNPSLVISLFIKKIVHIHYVNIFARISLPKAKEILYASRKDIKNGLKMIDDSFPKNSRNTGYYELAKQMFMYNLELAITRRSKHMCWENCKNASPNQCEKIKDVRKKTIDQYDFITNGYQKYNHTGELIDFCVTSCDNYERNFRNPRPLFTTNVDYEDLYESHMGFLRK